MVKRVHGVTGILRMKRFMKKNKKFWIKMFMEIYFENFFCIYFDFVQMSKFKVLWIINMDGISIYDAEY